MQIAVSAPGKIILAGEHGVVCHKPAIITTINRRVRVVINHEKFQISNFKSQNQIVKGKKIKIIDRNLKINEEVEIEEILEFTEKANKEWEEFNETKEVTVLKRIAEKPAALIKIAIGETIRDWQQAISNKQKVNGNKLARHKAQVIDNFELEIESEISIGRGMGSSAALVVTVVGATYIYLNKILNIKYKKLSNVDLENIHQIAILAERKIHGNPSGGDTAAVVYGGTVWFKKNSDGSRTITPLDFPKEVYKDFILIDSGKPLETTGEMVGEVRKKIKARKRWGREVLDKIEEAAEIFKKGLENKNRSLIVQAINQNERCLEKLGVVSPSTKEIIRKLKDFGIAAKVTGAGGKKRSSGMVLCYGPLEQGSEKIKDLAKRMGVEVLEGEFGGNGIEIINS